jgi:hypothetical protein
VKDVTGKVNVRAGRKHEKYANHTSYLSRPLKKRRGGAIILIDGSRNRIGAVRQTKIRDLVLGAHRGSAFTIEFPLRDVKLAFAEFQ